MSSISKDLNSVEWLSDGQQSMSILAFDRISNKDSDEDKDGFRKRWFSEGQPSVACRFKVLEMQSDIFGY